MNEEVAFYFATSICKNIIICVGSSINKSISTIFNSCYAEKKQNTKSLKETRVT